MTVREDVIRLLRNAPDGMSDGEIAAALGKLHPHVNMACRGLADAGVIVRDRSAGTIVNRLVDGEPPAHVASPPSAAQGEWFWEGNVQAAVVSYFAANGWRVTRVADTASHERGVDVTAERSGSRLLVEVKGWPSTTYARGDKAGQPKPTQPTLQAKHWFADAVLTGLRLRGRHADDEIVLAFPDMQRYRTLAAEIAGSLRACAVSVWFVTEQARVSE